MKIDVYEIPVSLKRENGEVKVTIHEDKKRLVGEESVNVGDATMIPNIAKQLADHNNTQRTLVANTMLKGEEESTAKVFFKYLS